MTTSTRHARAITRTAETEQEDHMSDISDESDSQTMGYARGRKDVAVGDATTIHLLEI